MIMNGLEWGEGGRGEGRKYEHVSRGKSNILYYCNSPAILIIYERLEFLKEGMGKEGEEGQKVRNRYNFTTHYDNVLM